MIKGRTRISKAILLYSVFAILMTSGGGYLHSILLIVFAALAVVMKFKRVSYRSLIRGGVLLAYITFNSLIINGDRFSLNDYVITAIRILCLALMVDKIGMEEFKKAFVQIMLWLAGFSLIWYIYMFIFPNGHIPFEINGTYVGSFYHIIGFSRSGHVRNAGIFWEPGVFQIYLNIALAIISIEPKKYRDSIQKFILLSITLLTTGSTGGYLIYALMLSFILVRKKSGKIGRRLKALLVPLFTVFAAIESATSIITSKLINKGSSFASRHDDLLIGYSIFTEYPFFGTGICSDNTSIRNTIKVSGLVFHDQTKLANSNGLVNILSRSGLVFFVPYMYFIFKSYMQWFNRNKINALELFLISLLSLINEPLGFTPFWLTFFFVWSKEDRFIRTAGKES